MKNDILAQFDDMLRMAGEDGITTVELMKAKGCGRGVATKIIGQKIADGAIEYAGKRAVTNIAGARQLVPVYRLVRKVKKKAGKP